MMLNKKIFKIKKVNWKYDMFYLLLYVFLINWK